MKPLLVVTLGAIAFILQPRRCVRKGSVLSLAAFSAELFISRLLRTQYLAHIQRNPICFSMWQEVNGDKKSHFMRAFLISSVFLTSGFASFQASFFLTKGTDVSLTLFTPQDGLFIEERCCCCCFLNLLPLLAGLSGALNLTRFGQRPFLFFLQMPR